MPKPKKPSGPDTNMLCGVMVKKTGHFKPCKPFALATATNPNNTYVSVHTQGFFISAVVKRRHTDEGASATTHLPKLPFPFSLGLYPPGTRMKDVVLVCWSQPGKKPYSGCKLMFHGITPPSPFAISPCNNPLSYDLWESTLRPGMESANVLTASAFDFFDAEECTGDFISGADVRPVSVAPTALLAEAPKKKRRTAGAGKGAHEASDEEVDEEENNDDDCDADDVCDVYCEDGGDDEDLEEDGDGLHEDMGGDLDDDGEGGDMLGMMRGDHAGIGDMEEDYDGDDADGGLTDKDEDEDDVEEDAEDDELEDDDVDAEESEEYEDDDEDGEVEDKEPNAIVQELKRIKRMHR